MARDQDPPLNAEKSGSKTGPSFIMVKLVHDKHPPILGKKWKDDKLPPILADDVIK